MEYDEKLTKRLSWLMAIVWMGMIFAFSAQNAADSSDMSGTLVAFVSKMILYMNKIFPGFSVKLDVHLISFVIRKTAHAFLYAVLGILVSRAFCPKMPLRKRDIMLTIFFCVLYAVSDEMHQMLSPGRSGEIRDVIIDAMGAGIGVLLRALWWKFCLRLKR